MLTLVAGGAIFNTQISTLLPHKVAAAAIEAGLPAASIPSFVADLAHQQTEALAKIPGITPTIIAAGVAALEQTYLESFRAVWITAACFAAVGVVG